MAQSIREVKELRKDGQAGFERVFRRTYRVPIHASLADVDLEEGDWLPVIDPDDPAYAEIMESGASTEKIKDLGAGERLVQVRATKSVMYDGT